MVDSQVDVIRRLSSIPSPASRLGEEVVTDVPLIPNSITPVVVEHLCARQEEEPPVHVPLRLLSLAVSLLKDWHDLLFIIVKLTQPVLARFVVMIAIHTPLILEVEAFGEEAE